MIFGNPMTIIQVSEELNGEAVFLYEALNAAKISYGGKPLNFSQFIPAPLVTNAEIEMIGGQMAKLSLTFEATASSIMQLRRFFNPLAKVSYKWFHIQYGYFPEMMSKVYSFALYALPTATMGSENSLTMELFSIYCKNPLIYQAINGTNNSIECGISQKSDLKTVVGTIFQGIPSVFNPLDEELLKHPLVGQQTPLDGKGKYLAVKELLNPKGTKGLSVDFSYVLIRENKTTKAYVKFLDPSNLKKNLEAYQERNVAFVSKEMMPNALKLKGADLQVYPMISYSFDEPMPLFEGPPAKTDENGMTVLQELAEVVGKWAGPGAVVNSSINDYIVKKGENANKDWLSQTITITSLMVPDLIPFKDVITITNPIINVKSTRHLISGVKYSLIGSYEMTITAWGMEYKEK